MTETVTIPKAEYDAMVARLEDLEDLAAANAAEIDERLPLEFVERLMAADMEGASRIRLWREYRGMSQKALADAAGVKQGYLSEIESGRKPGSVAAFKALAEALRVDIDDLV